MTECEGYIAATLISMMLVSILVLIPAVIKIIFKAFKFILKTGVTFMDDIIDFFDND